MSGPNPGTRHVRRVIQARIPDVRTPGRPLTRSAIPSDGRRTNAIKECIPQILCLRRSDVPDCWRRGYGIHRYWVSGNLTLLQRIYFKQYMKSSWRSSLFNSKSHYTVLERTAIDPQTKKEKRLSVLENDVVPALDDANRLQYDKRHYPILFLKGGVEHKNFYWSEITVPDITAYNWFRANIYDDQSIFDMWRPAWLGAIVIFIARRESQRWPELSNGPRGRRISFRFHTPTWATCCGSIAMK